MAGIGKIWASGPCIGLTVREGGNLYQDALSVEIGAMAMGTADYKGAGMFGTLNLPATLQMESVELTIKVNGVSAQSGDLARPGTHDFVIAAPIDRLVNGTSEIIPTGVKIYTRAVTKTPQPLATLAQAENNEGSYVYEMLDCKIYVDGAEAWHWDKLNGINKINGKDYAVDVSSLL